MLNFKNFLSKSYLSEAVSVSGNEMVAYLLVLAEEYKAMPKFDAKEAYRWKLMAEHTTKFLPKIFSSVNVIYTKDDPYKTEEEMVYDIVVNKRMKIYKSDEDSVDHPVLTPKENDEFRTEHDFVGHYLPNSKEFKEFLKKNNISSTKDSKFKNFAFKKNNFTIRGEMNVYLTQTKTMPTKAIPAVFTEVVGQASVFFATNDFTENKVGVMKGVDFKNIGEFTSGALESRKQKYLQLLNNDAITSFMTGYGSLDKSKINWALISHGEGKKRSK